MCATSMFSLPNSRYQESRMVASEATKLLNQPITDRYQVPFSEQHSHRKLCHAKKCDASSVSQREMEGQTGGRVVCVGQGGGGGGDERDLSTYLQLQQVTCTQ